MEKLIPEVIDLVEVLAEIAASMKPHPKEKEKCKSNKRKEPLPKKAQRRAPSAAPYQPPALQMSRK